MTMNGRRCESRSCAARGAGARNSSPSPAPVSNKRLRCCACLALLAVAGLHPAGCGDTGSGQLTGDASRSDGAVGDAPADGPADGRHTPVDQPLPPLPIACTPSSVGLDEADCAKASVVVFLGSDLLACQLRVGEPRSAQPVLTFERQDETCVNDKVIEVMYFARVNDGWRLVATSHGKIEADGQRMRELPLGQLAQVHLQTVASPAMTFALSFRLSNDGLVVEKLELLR